MTISERYEEAKKIYKQFGTDTDKALEKLLKVPVSIHCWQGDDVIGFDGDDVLSGGIQTTGNYPGKATSPSELMADMEKVIGLVPGRHKLNLHASYAIAGPGEKIERDNIKPEHFTEWVRFAKKHGMGIDFNPTLFAHRMVKDGLTLSSPVKEVREYWIRHCKCCLKISEYFAEETGEPCVMNIWIPDGFKDIPADRFTPRRRFKDSLDEILSSFEEEIGLMMEINGKWFYKAPHNKTIDLMPAFFDNMPDGEKDIEFKMFATPDNGVNEKNTYEDWNMNYYKKLVHEPEFRIRYEPVATVG